MSEDMNSIKREKKSEKIFYNDYQLGYNKCKFIVILITCFVFSS